MQLIRCRIAGFGKLVDRSLRFGRGLNVVFAPNEEGKTTLQHFLIALLYGPLKPAVRSQRRLEPWADLYRPWSAAEYGGTLWCRLAGGDELEVRRRFDDPWVEVRSETGEDVTGRFLRQRNSEVLFAQELFGMPKELFESLSVVRETRAGELGDPQPVRDRIANLATTGEEQVSIQRTLARLDAALEAIGSERAPTRPYRMALERRVALARERAEIEMRRAAHAAGLMELERVEAAVAGLEARRERDARRVSAARRRDAVRVVVLLQELGEEIAVARAELAGSAHLDFPAERLQELENLAGAETSIGARRAEAAAELERARAHLRDAADDRYRLAQYEGIDPELASRRAAERLARHDAALAHCRDDDAALGAARDAADRLRERVRTLPAPLADEAIDWDALAEEAGARERHASMMCAGLAGDQLRIAQEAAALGRHRTGASAVAWGSALAVPVLAAALLAAPASAAVPLGLGAGLAAILGCWAAVRAARLGRALRGLEAEAAAVEARHSEERRVLDGAFAELGNAAAAAGSPTVEGFLGQARAAAELRRELADSERRIAEQSAAALASSAAEAGARANLDAELAAVGIGPPPEPEQYRAEVDRLISELKQFRELDGVHRGARQRVEALGASLDRLDEEQARIASGIRAILDSGGVASLESFRDGCRARARARAAAERLESLEREQARVAAGRTLDEWRRQVDELAGRAGDAEAPPTAAAEDEEREAAAALARAREERARLAERIRRAFENQRPIAEIGEEEAEVERRVAELEAEREALAIAREAVEALGRERQEVLAPELNRAVEARFRRLSAGRYAAVKITPAFDVLVRESADGALRKLDHLSRGARDQLYLALRFAILELVTETFEPCPCLLDEPFAAYDAERLASAFEVVREEATRRQLVLFTCREEVYAGAVESGASVVDLSEAAPGTPAGSGTRMTAGGGP